MKLTSLLDGRMSECDKKITDLAQTIDVVKTEVEATAAATQQRLDEQSKTIGEQLSGNNAAIMQQMQSLFSKMQEELKSSLTAENPDSKRQKVQP